MLRYFVALAQAGTYTRAAEILRVATPSLSQQISKLEHEIGVRLFERDHRGARLTDAGSEFFPMAINLLSVHDQAIGVVRRHRRAAQQQIRILGKIAGLEVAGTTLKVRAVDDFKAHNPLPLLLQIAHLPRSTFYDHRHRLSRGNTHLCHSTREGRAGMNRRLERGSETLCLDQNRRSRARFSSGESPRSVGGLPRLFGRNPSSPSRR